MECKSSTQMDINEKLKQQLANEEAKAIEMKEFVSTLMKQKEEAIKKDLEQS